MPVSGTDCLPPAAYGHPNTLLDERNSTHPHRRLPQMLAMVTLTLILPLAAIFLRHSALAAWIIRNVCLFGYYHD